MYRYLWCFVVSWQYRYLLLAVVCNMKITKLELLFGLNSHGRMPFLTALQVWVRIRTPFSLTFLPSDHNQSIPVGLNSLLTTMKLKTEIYNP